MNNMPPPKVEGIPESPQPFVSYSANFEDVILNRIFAGKSPGFYVDVGAAHPTFESDTKMLYDAGWSGINIEPNPSLFPILEAARPRDRNFCAVLAERVSELDYYEIVGTGLSTCNPDFAERAREKGYSVVQTQVVTTTLKHILDAVGPASVELLKVDVEGLEEEVLAGNDWEKYRPSVMIIEATYPESPDLRPTHIRSFLTERDYEWRYFDGLNDFYTRADFPVSDSAFDRPPNVFDHFKTHAMRDAEERAKFLENAFRTASEYAKDLERAIEVARTYAVTLEQEVDRIRKYTLSLESELKKRGDLPSASDRFGSD